MSQPWALEGIFLVGGVYSMLSRGRLACDNAISFTMVTADGEEVVEATTTVNEDLFWGLRGGGGGTSAYWLMSDIATL